MNEADKIVAIFSECSSIGAVEEKLGISAFRVRKILTAKGIVINETHRKILSMHKSGKTVEEIMSCLKISKRVVQSYLPPQRPLYRINQSANAKRIAEWRKKKNKQI